MPDQIASSTCNFSRHKSEAATSNFLIHSHNCYEIYYIVSGDLVFLYNGSEFTLAPHTMLIIPPALLHGIHVCSTAPYDRYTFHFVPDFFAAERRSRLIHLLPSLETLRSGSSPIPFFIEDADRFSIQNSLDEILSLSKHDEPTRLFSAPILLESLLTRLFLVSGNASHTLPASIMQDPPELANVLDYLRRHQSDRITLDSLSEQFFLSRSQLNHLFRKHFGTSVMNYLAMQRMSYAQKLLISGMQASEVASTVGYTDYSTFYRSYAKFFGHPPKEDIGNGHADRSIDVHNRGVTLPFSIPFSSGQDRELLFPGTLPDIGYEETYDYSTIE